MVLFSNLDINVNKQLWAANYAIKSSINLETGKELPLPFRMSAFVPVNIPIAFGLICLPATQFNIMFFNFVNQTYNASMNWANSSGKGESMKQIGMSYTLALVSSIGVAMLLKRRFSKLDNVGVVRGAILRIFPSAAAGFLNLFFMRSDYILQGIDIKNEKGDKVGVSKKCGIKAVLEGALSRCFLPIPLIANHFIVTYMATLPLPYRLRIFFELALCGICLGLGLPGSIAVFKQYGTCKVSSLEPELREKLAVKDVVYYNKGL